MKFRRHQSKPEMLSFSSCLAQLIDEHDRLSDEDRERLTRAANVLHDYRHAIRAPFAILIVANPTRPMVAGARAEIVDIWTRYHPDLLVKQSRFDNWLLKAGAHDAYLAR